MPDHAHLFTFHSNTQVNHPWSERVSAASSSANKASVAELSSSGAEPSPMALHFHPQYYLRPSLGVSALQIIDLVKRCCDLDCSALAVKKDVILFPSLKPRPASLSFCEHHKKKQSCATLM